jgi:hypothetical protein
MREEREASTTTAYLLIIIIEHTLSPSFTIIIFTRESR